MSRVLCILSRVHFKPSCSSRSCLCCFSSWRWRLGKVIGGMCTHRDNIVANPLLSLRFLSKAWNGFIESRFWRFFAVLFCWARLGCIEQVTHGFSALEFLWFCSAQYLDSWCFNTFIPQTQCEHFATSLSVNVKRVGTDLGLKIISDLRFERKNIMK